MARAVARCDLPVIAELPARRQVERLPLKHATVVDSTLAGHGQRFTRGKRALRSKAINQFQRQITQRNHLPQRIQPVAFNGQIATAEQFACRILINLTGINTQLRVAQQRTVIRQLRVFHRQLTGLCRSLVGKIVTCKRGAVGQPVPAIGGRCRIQNEVCRL